MNRKNMGASTSVLLSLMDIFVLVAAVGLDLMVFGMHFLEEARYRWLLIILFLVFAEIFIISSRAGYLYNVTMFLYTDRMIKKNTLAFLLSACPVGMLLLYTCPLREAIDFYLTFLLFDYCLLVIKVWLTKPIVNLHHRQYTFRTAFLGKRERYDLFRRYLSKTSIPYTDVGYIARNRREYEAAKNDYIGCAEDLEDLIRNYHIDQIFVGQDNDASLAEAQQYLDLCMNMGVTVRFIIDFYKRGFAKSYVSSVGTYPIVVYHTVALNTFAAMWKRVMDIFGGIFGIILTSPIMLMTAIAIKLDSPGPVIFKQTRVGMNGRHFQIYKFRSMRTDAEACKQQLEAQNEMGGGVMFKIKNDPRITRVGRVIRKLSIDELPQFFNVVGGSMSLVGTRPPTLDEVEKYKTDQWRRISIKPGITGMWQVSGRSNVKDFEDIVRLDVQYIDNWSLWLDFKILLKTVMVVLKHGDAC